MADSGGVSKREREGEREGGEREGGRGIYREREGERERERESFLVTGYCLLII